MIVKKHTRKGKNKASVVPKHTRGAKKTPPVNPLKTKIPSFKAAVKNKIESPIARARALKAKVFKNNAVQEQVDEHVSAFQRARMAAKKRKA
jgi:hypothetical protein